MIKIGALEAEGVQELAIEPSAETPAAQAEAASDAPPPKRSRRRAATPDALETEYPADQTDLPDLSDQPAELPSDAPAP